MLVIASVFGPPLSIGPASGLDAKAQQPLSSITPTPVTHQLETAINHYLDIDNSNTEPFTWVKSPDDILASIERFCLQTSHSGH